MKSQALAKFAQKTLPDKPGVYFFVKKSLRKKGSASKSGKETILYIGRATSLRDRVGSYFRNDLMETRGPLIAAMLDRADGIKWQETDSVLEAIILESNLIKKHQPKHNTDEKDDKSYNYVIITDEDFPRVMLMRGRELEKMAEAEAEGADIEGGSGALFKIKKKFGPYPQGGLLREALSIIRKIFPFRDGRATDFRNSRKTSPNEAFYQSIGLSPDTSSPEAKKDYARTVRNLTLFFEGKKKALIRALEREMKTHAKTREFEKAGRVKRTLYALGHIQDVSLIKKSVGTACDGMSGGIFRIEAYDVAHLGGSENVGVMTIVEVAAGNVELSKSEYRKFKISRDVNDDVGSLSEMLRRRLNHPEWRMPDLIVVDGGQGQINAAEKIIAEKTLADFSFSKIPVVSVVKDDRHRARDIMRGTPEKNTPNIEITAYKSAILLANSEAHRFAITFHRKRLSKKMLN